MVSIEDVMRLALAQKGDRYVFGSEGSPLAPDPAVFDCSELVAWACARAELTPAMPDGAHAQWMHCCRNQLAIPVERALTVRGALLFAGWVPGRGREPVEHAALSLGNGTSIEARGKTWGVGTRAGRGRFQLGGLIPGVEYPPEELGLGSGRALPRGGRTAPAGGFGADTCTALQRALNRRGAGLPVDGELSPRTVQALQRYLGVSDDGAIDPGTIRALQRHLGASQDGQWTRDTILRLRAALGSDTF